MPFQSKAQERWMRANKPEMAEEWSAHTSKKKRANMPERVNKRGSLQPTDNDRKGRQGTAMAASGATITGAGLLASGLPGRKEPDALEVFNTRGTTRKKRPHAAAMQQFKPAAERDPRELMSPFSRANRKHNWDKVKSLPRAGVLGFRANVHDGFVANAKKEMPKNPTLYDKGTLAGKLKSEREIVRGMRIARKVGHGATLGGIGLTAAGVQRLKSADKPKKGQLVKKRDGQRHDRVATGALAAGGTTAGIGLAGQKVSGKYERKYTRQAKDSTLRAQKLAPAFGGLQVTPAKTDPTFGTVLRPSRVTMKPEVPNWKIREEKLYNQVPKKNRHEAARLRGMAAQEKHFAEVFRNVKTGFGRAKIAGAGVAAGGGIALNSSRATRNDAKNRPVRKAHAPEYRPGDQLYRRDARVSPWRATEAIAGVTLAVAGGSRTKMLGGAIKAGRKLSYPKNLPFERAHSVRNAAQKGTRQVGPALRRNDTMRGTTELIPRRLQPAAATVVGMGMIGHARPIKREKYVPSNRRR